VSHACVNSEWTNWNEKETGRKGEEGKRGEQPYLPRFNKRGRKKGGGGCENAGIGNGSVGERGGRGGREGIKR